MESVLCSRMTCGSSYCLANSCKTDSAVEGCPPGVFSITGMFISSNRISWSCLGEDKLNSLPAFENACSSRPLMRWPKFLDWRFKISESITVPFCSMSDKTGMSGSSISLSTFCSVFCFFKCSPMVSYICRVMSASSAA